MRTNAHHPVLFLGVAVLLGSACVEEGVMGRTTVESVGAEEVTALRLDGKTAGEQLGLAVAALGDLDGDGIPEIAGGAPAASRDRDGCADSLPKRGVARIYNGADGKVLKAHCGQAKGEFFGRYIKNIGDVDGDGTSDYAIAAPAAASESSQCPDSLPGRGYVKVFSGKSHELIRVFCGYSSYENLGKVIVAPGDLDGDGVADFVLGSPTASTHPDACPERPTDPDKCPLPKEGKPDSPCSKGYVEGRSGKDGTVLFALCGDRPGDAFGSWIARSDSLFAKGGLDADEDGKADFSNARSLDGDVLPDIAVGGPAATCDEGGVGSEGVTYFLFSTNAWGLGEIRCGDPDAPGEGDFPLEPTEADLDGDGFNDFVIGSPDAPGFEGVCDSVAVLGGVARAFLIDETGGTTLVSVICGGQGDALGASYDLWPQGDADGDGNPDPALFVVGAPGMNPTGDLPNAGSILVYAIPPP